jgi:hypothetical protein
MTDIVDRLRALDAWALHDAKAVMHEAANEIDRLRGALLMWLGADDAGDGQECINAIAHARSVVGEPRAALKEPGHG